jgi:hypothetical protein
MNILYSVFHMSTGLATTTESRHKKVNWTSMESKVEMEGEICGILTSIVRIMPEQNVHTGLSVSQYLQFKYDR